MARAFKSMDGNTAAAHVAYAFTEVAAIYPITPSSVMAELCDDWAANGRENIFGQKLKLVEMQSEGGAAGAVHGSLMAGALTTTFTASQGLLLMIPNMYKIAAEQLPGVIHVSARALATHALSIFGDHSDVMACRGTGFAMLASSNPQEVMDLAAVTHLSAIEGHYSFLHFFDGFRTSHEIQKIAVWDYDDLKDMVDMDAVAAFRARALNPEHPTMRGSAQNPDIFFQVREAGNSHVASVVDVVVRNMEKVNAKIGTNYKPFNYYGAPDAKHVIVSMGSSCDAIEEVVDYLNERGGKVGLVTVHLYRPFSAKHLAAVLPETVERIAVLDRCKEPGALGEPLYQDVVTALAGTKFGSVPVVGGRYGLGSKDTGPSCYLAAFRNLEKAEPQNPFTIGITDDVTNLSLPMTEIIDTQAKSNKACKFWGLGSDGTVGANKNSIKIIGDNTDLKIQAYFQYDSKKSGGVTISHLRFGPEPIRSTYYVTASDFVACHQASYLEKYPMAQDLKPGGTFLINCGYDAEQLGKVLPAEEKRYIANNDIQVYTVDAAKLGAELGLGNKFNMILQAAFFKLADIIPIDDAEKYMKDAIVKTYGHKGEDVVSKNKAAVDAGLTHIVKVEIPESWKTATEGYVATGVACDDPEMKQFLDDVLVPANNMVGDSIPVSKLMNYADGTLPAGTAAYEKRGISAVAPVWLPENCIQCNFCSYVCPHAVIRPFAMNADELAAAPEGTLSKPMAGKGVEGLSLSIQVSALDCTGCGSCVNVCPAKEKALKLVPITEEAQERYNYAFKNVTKKDLPFDDSTVKGSQFRQPLFEFSGACAGCGETPYAKLITQLYGDHMFIANATGCSSIWGGSAPSTPYTPGRDGRGPAWSNSLFEDNAEYGLGEAVAMKQRRARLHDIVEKLVAVEYVDEDVAAAGKEWLDKFDDAEGSRAAGEKLLALCKAAGERDYTGTPFEEGWLKNGKKCPCEACGYAREVVASADLLTKPSMWIFGGDGWAYDIGYGGLDHVLASGENVNIFVFDTEVYSNTGGQSSKSTPTGAVAQFAAAGKATKKKDLAQIAMTYGYVYVAQIAMGADYNQTIKAIREAESYPGPSIVIAYAPCINHGAKAGMGRSMETMKRAVDAGYWFLFRYDPRKEKPFQLDSKAPKGSYLDYIMSEVRYSSLKLAFPERAHDLFEKAEEESKEKFEKLQRREEAGL